MLKLYNSLTRRVEEFRPVNRPNVGMYTCGPTVYQFQHIGNFRAFTTADILVRVLRGAGIDSKFVMNITDVGHLTNDQVGGADTGEDKIEKTALREGKTAREVADFYTEAFLRDWQALNLTEPAVFAKATEHIKEQIELIAQLTKKGFTYRTKDGVYFDTAKFPNYGKMSSGYKSAPGFARVEVNPEKHNPRDFALWKLSPSTGGPASAKGYGEARQMEWESPWGVGFPGWHIECSAMSLKYLTEAFDAKGRLRIEGKKNYTIDIHTGGVDHKEIHHPNEIAQSEGATGKKFVKYWVHTAFMMVAGQKMSKSLGNIYRLYDLEKEGVEALALRYLYFQTHYRQEMNFTFPALDGATQALKKLRMEVATWGVPAFAKGYGEAKEFEERFVEAVNDDLNMSKALSIVWELVKSGNPPAAKAASIFKMDEILGFDLQKGSAAITTEKQIVPPEVKELLREREALRKAQKYNMADQVRKKIKDLGYEIEDTKKGTKVIKK